MGVLWMNGGGGGGGGVVVALELVLCWCYVGIMACHSRLDEIWIGYKPGLALPSVIERQSKRIIILSGRLTKEWKEMENRKGTNKKW